MTIGIIGAGNMGSALCKGFLNYPDLSASDIIVSDHSEEKLQELKTSRGVRISKNNGDCLDADIILLAIKPQQLEDVAKDLKGNLKKECIIISILAGVQVSRLQQLLGHKAILRAMPNTPVLVNEGVVGWYASEQVPEEKKRFISRLFAATGHQLELEKESQIDELTAISGCGPGFFFTIFDAWEKATTQLHLEQKEAKKLLIKTLKGSLTLLETSPDEAETLAGKVASKGGATQEGIDVLKKAKIEAVFSDMIAAALTRCRELGNQ